MKTVRSTLLTALLLAMSSVRLVAVGGPEIVITIPPLSRVVNSGADVSFTVLAVGAGTLSYQWWHGPYLIQEATNSTLTLTNVQIADAGEYVVRVLRGSQGVETLPAILMVDGVSEQDLKKPDLYVTSPHTGFERVYSDRFTFSGTADDDAGVIGIYYQQNGSPWVTLPPAVDWTCGVTLQPGTNEFLFKAADLAGNYSVTKKVVLSYCVTQALSLTILGNGQVVGAANGQGLELGRNYTLRAVPTAGNYFSYWNANGVISTDPTLSLLMESGSIVTANFVVNPFLSVQGSYSGLFYDINNPAHETSGLLTFKVTDQGKFTGKLVLGGASYSCGGQFGMDLRAQATITRSLPSPAIVIALQLSAVSDRVVGSVGIGAPASTLEGYRSTFHPTMNPATSFAAKYTLALPGSDDTATSPRGNGSAALSVTSAGGVTFRGVLGDGTPVTQKASLAANGQWAFYVPLYKGKGSILGWLTLADTGTSDVSGLLLWTKPGGTIGAFYPAGFVDEISTIGSRYVAPLPGNRALNLSNAIVHLEGGNLAAPTTSDVTLDTFNRITVTSTNANKLALKLSVSSGLMSGSFVNPQTLKKSVIKGVVLQRQNLGGGHFLGTNQSGSLFFGPADGSPIVAP